MNYYDKAIEIITDDGCDYKAIVVKLAQKHPSLLVKLAKSSGVNAWAIDAKSLYQSGKKIAAIKYCRQETGWDLKKAKEAVEDLL